jgi:hypothetical protein
VSVIGPWLPVVLHVERPVLIARLARGILDRVGVVAAERLRAERRVVVIDRRPLLQVEPVVRVPRRGVVDVARLDEEAGLDLVGPLPARLDQVMSPRIIVTDAGPIPGRRGSRSG